MSRVWKSLVWVVFLAVFCAACSGNKDGSSGPENEATKPPPQVRVELLPTLTPLPITPTAEATSTAEVAAPVQIYIDPPADEYAISDEVEAMMNNLDRDIRILDNNLK